MMTDENQNPDYLEYNLLGDEGFLDDETDEWEDGDLAPRSAPATDVDELIDQLAHDEELPSHIALRALSDLSRQDAETVAEHWSEIRGGEAPRSGGRPATGCRGGHGVAFGPDSAHRSSR